MRKALRLGMMAVVLMAAGGGIYWYIEENSAASVEAYKQGLEQYMAVAATASRPVVTPKYGAPTFSTFGNPSGALALDFSPDGQRVVWGEEYGWLRIWNIADRHWSQELSAHRGDVTVVRFAPDGKYLLSGGEDGTLLMWDVGTSEIEYRYVARRPVYCAEFLPDGKYFVAATDEEVRVWDVAKERARPQPLATRDICTMAVSGKGEVAVARHPGVVTIYEPMTGRVVASKRRMLPGGEDAFRSGTYSKGLGFTKEGDLLIADRDGIWRWNRLGNTVKLLVECQGARALAMIPGTGTIVHGTEGGAAYVKEEGVDEQFMDESDLHEIAVSPRGDSLAIGASEKMSLTSGWVSNTSHEIKGFSVATLTDREVKEHRSDAAAARSGFQGWD